MKRHNRAAALAVVVAGVATLLSVVLMRTQSGPELPPYMRTNPEGFKSAMLWFELAGSREEVFQVLGPVNSPEGSALRRQLDTANYYDFAFMTCYSLYNAALIFFVTHLNVYRLRYLLQLKVFFILGLILSAAMLIGDIIENLQLLDMTKATVPDAISLSTLTTLQYWTRIKWGAIFIVALMLCAGYASYFRRIPTLFVPAVYAVAGISGLVAISLPNARPLLEIVGAPAIAVAWTASLAHAAVVAVRGPARLPLPARLHAHHQRSAQQEA